MLINLLVAVAAIIGIFMVIGVIITAIGGLSHILACVVGFIVIPVTVLYVVLYLISWVF